MVEAGLSKFRGFGVEGLRCSELLALRCSVYIGCLILGSATAEVDRGRNRDSVRHGIQIDRYR